MTRPHPLKDRRAALSFLRHFLEMLVAMVAGMMLLAPLWELALGRTGLLERPEPAALVMAANMSLGMAGWMRFRGHSWPSIAEMCAAMFVPFLILFVPLWLGVLSGDAMLAVGHVLMLPAMAAAMLLRPDEYTGGHRHHDDDPDPSALPRKGEQMG